jgi:hypothetical protein
MLLLVAVIASGPRGSSLGTALLVSTGVGVLVSTLEVDMLGNLLSRPATGLFAGPCECDVGRSSLKSLPSAALEIALSKVDGERALYVIGAPAGARKTTLMLP